MPNTETVSVNLYGMYHDVLRDSQGCIIWDRGWHKNTIVVDCRRLLAGFMRGDAKTLGIQGLEVGMGLPAWDQPPGLPMPGNNQAALVDPNPFTLPQSSLKMDYLDNVTGNVSASPTNRLQIVATLGPHVPNWPEPTNPNPPHPTATLREFGLIGQLDGASVLINYVTHSAIVKDPLSTLERTIWLVF